MQTPVATFNIYYQQFLNPEGQLTQDLPDFAQDPQHLLHLYKTMVFTRIFNAKAIALQRTGRLGTFPSVEGEEAIGVGIASAMEPNDVFCPYYREYGAQLLRGVTPEEILLYWGGDERGSDFKNCIDFPFCIPIGSQILHGAGVAFAMQLRKQPHCAIAAVGDGGTSEGDFYEAINVAGVWKLPLVVVVNNNQWAISVPLSKQTAAQTLAQKAIAAGFEGLQVDGDDVIAVEHAVRYALAKARRGEGPTLVEAITYRIGDHTTADDAKRYRDVAEVEQHKHEDPMLRLQTYLVSQKLWDDAQEQQLRDEYQQQVADAVERYLAIEPQAVNAMFDYLYAELPHALEEQYHTAIEAAGKL
jgi:2-oxoisovalerate dehydrogenase E1 component alpha subunit